MSLDGGIRWNLTLYEPYMCKDLSFIYLFGFFLPLLGLLREIDSKWKTHLNTGHMIHPVSYQGPHRWVCVLQPKTSNVSSSILAAGSRLAHKKTFAPRINLYQECGNLTLMQPQSLPQNDGPEPNQTPCQTGPAPPRV